MLLAAWDDAVHVSSGVERYSSPNSSCEEGVKALAGLIRLKPRLHATTPRGLLYHSIMRPHLAVHRTLSTGMLALLAVWHNHRVFTRGIHTGKKPLHLSGMTDAPTDWLTALGYPPSSIATPSDLAMLEVVL